MDQFIAPANSALDTSRHQHSCPGLSDFQWLQMGIERSLKECKTGRDFLQQDWAMAHRENSVGVSHFFETLKSNRRLDLVKEVNAQVAASMPTHVDCRIDELEDLAKVDIYAGDGHYHQTSTHELPIKGKRRAVGHFYTLNLRTHALTHLTAANYQGGSKKGEHDMHALKRMSTDQLVTNASSQMLLRYIKYRCPQTGTEYELITNHMKVRPERRYAQSEGRMKFCPLR